MGCGSSQLDAVDTSGATSPNTTAVGGGTVGETTMTTNTATRNTTSNSTVAGRIDPTALLFVAPPTTSVDTAAVTAAGDTTNTTTTTSSDPNKSTATATTGAVADTTTTTTATNTTTTESVVSVSSTSTKTNPNKKIPTGRERKTIVSTILPSPSKLSRHRHKNGGNSGGRGNHSTTTKNNNNHGTHSNHPITTRIRADTWETTLTDDLHILEHDDDNDNDDDHDHGRQNVTRMSSHHQRNSRKKQDHHSHHMMSSDESNPYDEMKDHHEMTMMNHIHFDPDRYDIDITSSTSSTTIRKILSSQPRLAASDHATTGSTTSTTPTSSLGPVQEQWRTIWETQSNGLVDPADVVAVVHTLMNHIINHMSTVDMTLLLRKVRTTIQETLPPPTIHKNHNNNNNNNSSNSNNNASTATGVLANGKQNKALLENQSSTSKIVAKVFSSGNSNNNNNNNSNNSNNNSNHNSTTGGSSHHNGTTNHTIITPAMYNESRIILDKFQLLNPTILLKILPKSIVLDSIIVLLLSLDVNPITSILLERVVTAATSSAEAVATSSYIEMDVNKKFNTTTTHTTTHHKKKIPKPSQIPVFLDETPTFDLPIGTSFASLAAMISMATSSTSSRLQKLQLLFYISMDPIQLKEFLLLHPAGGIPLWLLEVDQNTVIGLPSLTHYHYYGNAFLPCANTTATTTTTTTPSLSSLSMTTTTFIPSKSRTPVMVDALHVQKIVRLALQHVASRASSTNGMTTISTAAAATTTTTPPQSTPTAAPQPAAVTTRFAAPLSAFGRRSISLPDATSITSSATSKDNVDSNASGSNNSNNDPSAPFSSINKHKRLMNKLMNISEGTEIDSYSPINSEIEDALHHYEYLNKEYLKQYDVAEWTMEEFKHWCDVVITDFVLQVVMHHLFGAGIFPSPMIELELVTQQWYEWERQYNATIQENDKSDGQSIGKLLSDSVVSLIGGSPSSGQNGETITTKMHHPRIGTVFGGIGGMDGFGGTGRGVMYCIPTKWWNSWTDYVGWAYSDETPPKQRSRKASRPPSLETESLLENDPDMVTRGIMGSYEVMRQGLKFGVDYVLVPPGVWDTLYELYSGGPPLPRMVKPKETSSSFISLVSDAVSNKSPVKSNTMEELDNVVGNMVSPRRVMRLPSTLMVETHPWVLHVHICDPLQPYRRGDTGPVSIRVMVSPSQPLWRVLSEIVCRFTFQTYRAFDSDTRGRLRLWKKIETKDTPLPRYGPWNLLCKSRFAMLPCITNGVEYDGNFDELITNWRQYTEDATVETIGLQDQNNLMVEFAVLHRNGGLAWPREAAAEAGKVRRLADEDKQFRQTLLGVDDNGKALPNPPLLVGMDVDAMEFSGKWYTVKILEVQLTETDVDDEDDGGIESEVSDTPKRVMKKKVKVNFQIHGGHFDWIDVDSDRLQTPGRFASEANLQSPESPTSGNGNGATGDGRTKSGAIAKRSNSISESMVENTKSCNLPGYGACGLSNLGNSCYMNSAVQCMSYLPLLRSYLLGALYRTNGDLNRDNPLGTGGKLLEEFAELLRTMWSTKLAEKSPTRFRLHLGKSNEQFACADQQDAQEFLNYMIDVLHEDSNRVRKKPYVEALADVWVEQTLLPRVGEESWRRFLRRNQSIMADVAMGQALNTVTCPECNYSSRNFDPFNLLSIPIPTVADAVFQCTVIRRSTARNCPWILNKTHKADNHATRYPKVKSASQPPSEACTTEQYVIALSRLADGGDLRQQIQNLSGIRADQLRLCRAESVAVNIKSEDGSVTNRYIKIVPLSDKEGPASQLLKVRAPNDVTPRMPTQIIAFEMTLKPRQMKQNVAHDTDADDSIERDDLPSNTEKAQIERYLAEYGDEKECRLVDTDPTILAKAVSKSLWPRTDSEFRIGLRVDAKDHRNNWFVGSVVDVFDDEVSGGDSDTGQEVAIQQKKVRIHFDNFLPKWDEIYTIEHFKKGRVGPLYSFAERKTKSTEFVIHHRYTDRSNGLSNLFGHSFYVQCQPEWSNARACAHIIAQSSRYLRHKSKDVEVIRVFEKIQASVSELIDCLVEYDREYIRRALGVSEQCTEEEKKTPYRNPTFDATSFFAEADKKISALLQKFPFELRLCNAEPTTGNGTEEIAFPFAFNVAVGNFVSTRNAVIIHWREPSVEKKPAMQRIGLPSIMYVEPVVELHESCATITKDDNNNNNNTSKKKLDSSEIDLEYCLTEFCKVQKLPISDNWVCPRCKVIREGGQNMNLWRVPDLLTFHIKRFNMSARWHEKITTKVNFPMTGLDMSQWCHKESPVLQEETQDSCIYDLIGVMNHYGSLTGGHYVATCKATLCGRDGKEEVAYNFNGVGMSEMEPYSSSDEPTGWSLGRPKPKINQSRVDAAINSQSVADSSESMWLQFDDEVVEAIPPRLVVSEMAYVLFYRKRRITPSNIAKYSTLE